MAVDTQVDRGYGPVEFIIGTLALAMLRYEGTCMRLGSQQPYCFVKSRLRSAKPFISRLLPLGSRKNRVPCSPGCPLKRI